MKVYLLYFGYDPDTNYYTKTAVFSSLEKAKEFQKYLDKIHKEHDYFRSIYEYEVDNPEIYEDEEYKKGGE